jgi:hypothetical protein
VTPVEVDTEITQFGPPPERDEDEDDAAAFEPAISTRRTRRDLSVPAQDLAPPRTRSRNRGPRGEFSIPAARGIPADAVSGSIEPGETGTRRRRMSTQQPREPVRLAFATKREITVVIDSHSLTLTRQDALALAQIILTAFPP